VKAGAFDECDRPDAMLELAWASGLDRRAVIREGADAARLLLAGELESFLELFWPFPRPLEPVDLWSENDVSKINVGLRPHASAVIPGCLAGMMISWLVVAPRVSGLAANALILVTCLVCIGILGFALNPLIARSLRRRVAALDDERAFAIVLEQLRAGMARSPKLVPYVTKSTAKSLEQIVAHAPTEG
jgi:hypothetical protein